MTPKVMWTRPRGRARSVGRGTRRPAIEPRKRVRVPGAEAAFPSAESNTRHTVKARCGGTWRGRRPRACVEALCARTGRPCDLPTADGAVGRDGKSEDCNPYDERSRESDCPTVPTKSPNKGRRKRKQEPMANLNGHEGGNAGNSQGEPKEPDGRRETVARRGWRERGGPKGMRTSHSTHRTQSWERVSQRAGTHKARQRRRTRGDGSRRSCTTSTTSGICDRRTSA